jgi:predicted ATP-binding protein involved in virulence
VLTTVSSESIRVIDKNEIFASPPGTEGAESSRLLKRVLGVDVRPVETMAAKELYEYLQLVYHNKWDSQRAKELRERLDQKFQGEEPALQEADLYIENRIWEQQA